MPTTPILIDAVLVIDGHPARDVRDAREVLNRTGVQQRPGYAAPTPVDIEAGMWQIEVEPAVAHLLRYDGELDRHFGNCYIYATWSE